MRNIILVIAAVFFTANTLAVDCTTIKADKERLACYDKGAKRTAPKGNTAEAEKLVESTKKVISDRFKDPEATQYRNIVVFGKDALLPTVVCGELNAKNSFGAYTGFIRFTFMAPIARVDLDDDEYSSAFEKVLAPICNGTDTRYGHVIYRAS
jgi:hypothetical protein